MDHLTGVRISGTVMSMASSPPETPARKLRWFQYSLRSLMLLVLLASVGMSWFAVKMKRAREQKEAVEEIRKWGGEVHYDYEFQRSGNPLQPSGPPGPAWLRNLMGEDLFATVVWVAFGPYSSDADLEQLHGLTQLQTSYLGGRHVTDAGMEHLKGLPQLQTLDLDATDSTDGGVQHLKGLTQLQTLDLSSTQVTDAGLECLRGMSQLQRLRLTATNVTDEGVKRLKLALPTCEVQR